MFWKAKNECVAIDDTDMYYITFGKGNKALVILPGLGDGFATVRGLAAVMAISYRIYAQDYRVYFFSRKNRFGRNYSTRDMANDQAKAMELTGIKKAAVLGISQGGMIAQYLAIDHPDLVDKLILAHTLSRQNEMMQKVVGHWISLAEQKNYKALMIDTAEKSYSENYLKKYRFMYSLIGIAGKPADFNRFLIQADSCIRHDAYEELDKISCPVFVIGGGKDRITGADASAEIAAQIKNSELFIYEDLGHGAYEEAKDFHARVLDFLSEN